MSFVNERILEADKEKFNYFNFKNSVTDEHLEPWKWTIDRERNIFLVGLGGQGYEHSEIPVFLLLCGEKCNYNGDFQWRAG
ncbi:hypothetical protein [Clostridium gasigenes]|uniref:hypothetical protein n=1 Tax=Clostridium gasigenes TaxID=94869 RepID=UPI001C0CDB5F|nr:hypothetical protein [Clostridium gasigenes]MBU3104522.1 hypothetical protein [Clostridium gasigenes]MBU3134038.1 hypothetical protein [Clostridium gasigenes]MBU3137623.1 hypothetical protein [Clostridium gasigenes]